MYLHLLNPRNQKIRPNLDRASYGSRCLRLSTCVLFLLLAGCDGNATAAQSDNKTVATIGDDTVTHGDLVEESALQLENVELERVQCLANNEKKRHDVLEANLEGIVRQRLRELAGEEASTSGDAWVEQERAKRIADIPPTEIENIIRNNPRLQRANRQQIEPQIRNYLAEEAIYEELKERFPVDYQLEPYRVAVEAKGPAKGPESAAVTIVEFSDFQCPYCRRVVPALDQAVEHYGDKLRLVFRQFPLNSIHPEAQKAAEASLCAEDQGKFWPLHDAMFEDQKKLGVEDLKAMAERLGLDSEDFAQCLDSDKYAQTVSKDLRAGAEVGVTGTPALFINGRPMSGAVGFEALSEIIDEELELAAKD